MRKNQLSYLEKIIVAPPSTANKSPHTSLISRKNKFWLQYFAKKIDEFADRLRHQDNK